MYLYLYKILSNPKIICFVTKSIKSYLTFFFFFPSVSVCSVFHSLSFSNSLSNYLSINLFFLPVSVCSLFFSLSLSLSRSISFSLFPTFSLSLSPSLLFLIFLYAENYYNISRIPFLKWKAKKNVMINLEKYWEFGI